MIPYFYNYSRLLGSSIGAKSPHAVASLGLLPWALGSRGEVERLVDDTDYPPENGSRIRPLKSDHFKRNIPIFHPSFFRGICY